MFNNVALDVFIGLIAIFLLYSLLASILMEALAKFLCLRARITVKGIFKMLDDSDFSEDYAGTRFFRSICQNQFSNNLKGRPFTALFYAHPTIKNMGRNTLQRKPSSISPDIFSDTLIQLLRGDAFDGQQNQIDVIKANLKLGKTGEGALSLPTWYRHEKNTYKPLKKETLLEDGQALQINALTLYQLKQILYDSHSDIDRFKQKLISWYNEMMERANGWYIKQTRFLLFLIGFVIAVCLNVDAVYIAQKLANDKTARDKMIEFAGQIKSNAALQGSLKDNSDSALTTAFKNVNNNLTEANTIIGRPPFQHFECTAILGWLITALAVSLGAPFWFDLLGKIMAIRQSGDRKKKPGSKETVRSSNPIEEPIG